MMKPAIDLLSKPVNNVFFFKFLMEHKDKDNNILLPKVAAMYKGSDRNSELELQNRQNLVMKWKGTDYGEVKPFKTEKYEGTVNADEKYHGVGFLKFESGTTY